MFIKRAQPRLQWHQWMASIATYQQSERKRIDAITNCALDTQYSLAMWLSSSIHFLHILDLMRLWHVWHANCGCWQVAFSVQNIRCTWVQFSNQCLAIKQQQQRLFMLTRCSIKSWRNGANRVTATSSNCIMILQLTVSNQFQLLRKHNDETKLPFDSANNWPVDATVTVYINGNIFDSPSISLVETNTQKKKKEKSIQRFINQ